MQSTAIPTLIPIPFAATGGKNVIPNTTNPTPGGADFPNGFPFLTRTPKTAGGIPPAGLDMNGVLYAITAILQWQNAGGGFKYDSAFSTSIGGYPKYAILQGATGILYQNTVENNTTNPESAGVGWGPVLGATPATGNRSNQLATTAMFNTEFPKSTAESGYSTSPNGVITQWGTFTTNDSGYTTLTLPQPFPNALLSITGSQNTGTLAGAFINFNMNAKTLSTVPCAAVNSAASAYLAYAINYIAIGY